jgi:hypothetical protein
MHAREPKQPLYEAPGIQRPVGQPLLGITPECGVPWAEVLRLLE